MAKRSDFKRRERDFYPTPYEAVIPLLPHIKNIQFFDEPFAGDFRLAEHLIKNGKACLSATDIEPNSDKVQRFDALNIQNSSAEVFITNTPWPAQYKNGEPTLSFINHLVEIRPIWVLLPSDFAHNVYFSQVSGKCKKIVSVGRVKWMEGSKNTGMDNAAWYLFDKYSPGQPIFYGRSSV